jgi:hypothetical protein
MKNASFFIFAKLKLSAATINSSSVVFPVPLSPSSTL